jgi:hypothetical protein
MNSVTSRWSVLPVSTLWLVGVPLVAAWASIAILVGAWSPILERLFAGIDMTYVLTVFLTGAALAQALAWAIPRKPSQYWILGALLSLALLLAAVVPQESAGLISRRPQVLSGLGLGSVMIGCIAIWAARRNRCGDWLGEIPLTRISERWRHSSGGNALFRRPAAALFWSEVAPGCRTVVLGWFGVVLLIAAWACVTLWIHRPGLKMNWPLLGVAMLVEALPNFGVLWLLVCGLFLGCEPGLGFRTRLSAFHGTHPVTVGVLAGTRVGSLVLAWLCVWVPLLVLQGVLLSAGPGLTSEADAGLVKQASELLASRMAFSANAMIGALPVLLWGCLEGFPTLFLVNLVAWGWTWILSGFVHQEPEPAWLTSALGGLLTVKLTVALGTLLHCKRRGYTGWGFPAALLGGWWAVVGCMIWLFPARPGTQISNALALLLMIPLARLAACPLTMAENRHA